MWWPRTEGCHGVSTSGAVGGADGTPDAVARVLDVGIAEIASGIAGKIAGEGPDMAGKVLSMVGNALDVADRGVDATLPGAAREAP